MQKNIVLLFLDFFDFRFAQVLYINLILAFYAQLKKDYYPPIIFIHLCNLPFIKEIF